MEAVEVGALLGAHGRSLPRGGGPGPDPEPAGRLLAALWLGGPALLAVRGVPVAPERHAALLPVALRTALGEAPGVEFLTRALTDLTAERQEALTRGLEQAWRALLGASEAAARAAPGGPATPAPAALAAEAEAAERAPVAQAAAAGAAATEPQALFAYVWGEAGAAIQREALLEPSPEDAPPRPPTRRVPRPASRAPAPPDPSEAALAAATFENLDGLFPADEEAAAATPGEDAPPPASAPEAPVDLAPAPDDPFAQDDPAAEALAAEEARAEAPAPDEPAVEQPAPEAAPQPPRAAPPPPEPREAPAATNGASGARPLAANAASTPRAIGGFEVLELLGEGGMGRVYKARQTSLDRLVALKVLAPHLAGDAEYVARFEREAKAAARLFHPNVVGVIEAGRCAETELDFIAFEYVAGRTAKELLAEVGVLPEADALTLALAIAQALECAEQHGIVHRDLKLDNILIGADGIPRLLDLGLAKGKSDPDDAQRAVFVGTPRYIAPEQALGLEDVDVRADLYSLGLCLFELVTGELPFDEESPLALVARHIEEDVPDPRERVPTLDRATSQLVGWLCARDRDERYPTAKEAAHNLERALQGKPPVQPAGKGTGRVIAAPRRTATGIRSGPSGLGRGARTSSRRLSTPTSAEPRSVPTPPPSSAAPASPTPPPSPRTPPPSPRTPPPSPRPGSEPGRATTRRLPPTLAEALGAVADPILAEALGLASERLEEEDAEGLLLSDDGARAYRILSALGRRGAVRAYAVEVLGDTAFEGFERPVERARLELAEEADALRGARQVHGPADRRLPQLLDAGKLQDGRSYVVLEELAPLVSGAEPRLDPAVALDVFVNLLEAVRGLQGRRTTPLVLGNLQPGALGLRMPSAAPVEEGERALRLESGSYELVLVDQGGAAHRELLEQAGGRVRALLGSPLYLPPESAPHLTAGPQGSGLAPGKYGPRTDVYAAALTGYVLLTGERPYASHGLYRDPDPLRALLRLKREGTPPHSVAAVQRALGARAHPVLELLGHAFAPDPARRPTAAHLLKLARVALEVEERPALPGEYRFDALDNRLPLRQRLVPHGG